MATSAVTTTGLEEFRRSVQQLPASVAAAMRIVAQRTAEGIRNDAQRRLLSQLKTNTHRLADAIDVTEDVPDKQFSVTSHPPPGEPANVTIWNEHGTSKMAARPYMRPAAEAARDVYAREMGAAAVQAVTSGLA